MRLLHSPAAPPCGRWCNARRCRKLLLVKVSIMARTSSMVSQPGPLSSPPIAAKLYSRACFAVIGGLESGPGWDTIDEVRAMMLTFPSKSFRHLRALHHRPQGGAAGLCRSRIATGRVAYRIGYSPLFMVARAVWRTFERPYLVGGALMLFGYVQGYWKTKRISSPELVRFVRRQQMRRLLRMESQWR